MRQFHIGPWLIQPREGLFSRNGEVHHVEPKAMSVLLALVEGNGATVSRNELLDSVWPNQEVSDDVLTGCISTLRRALGDNPRKHKYIETVPKKGYRLVEPVRAPDTDPVIASSDGLQASSRRWVWAGLLTVALIIVGWLWQSQSDVHLPEAMEHSIAVLPFDVLSDRTELTYFASGLEEELIHQLAANPGLHVIARTSSARFGDSALTIREISERLGVRHVIEGSVRDTDDGMRITVQLIDAATDAHLWSRVFDAGQENLTGVQEQVGEAVSRLVAAGRSRPTGDVAATAPRHPVPEAAYRLFLLGEAHMRVGTGEAYTEASEYFSNAIRIAPSYALAWSRQAAADLLRYQYAGLPLDEAVSRAERALQRALEIDPGQPEALATLGLMYTYTGQYAQAEAYFERALERQPTLRFALHNHGFALWGQAKFEAALVPLRRALEIDPLSGVTNFLVADSLAGMGDFKGSVAQYRRCLKALPEHHACAVGLSTLQRLLGDYQDARESLEHAASLTDEERFSQLLSSALLALQLDELESAERYLERAQRAFPQDYVLLRGQLQLSLATGRLEAFLERFEKLEPGHHADLELALIGGLAYFHAGDCTKALEAYRPIIEGIHPYLTNIWDAEAGFSHAVVLAFCHGQLGNVDQREDMLALLRERVAGFSDAPVFAQRFLQASYLQLDGEPDQAQQELDRLCKDGWPLCGIRERHPLFR